MLVGIPKETTQDERRVALTPPNVETLKASGIDVSVESGAGSSAGFNDEAYEGKGARVVASRDAVAESDVLVAVHATANMLELTRSGQTVIGLADPLGDRDGVEQLAKRGVTLFALELLPRITRAQSMDVLSSMATIAGYKAVLVAAGQLTKMFPMLMTAAGTLAPAKVLVIGAGVAGLQAIATSRRLGAVVTGYDVRPEVKEEVESLGARFAEITLETDDARDERGYAKALGDDVYERQRTLMTRLVAGSDVVITTAAVPGRAAPRLITSAMVESMEPGSVIVDLAAATGGNCELTQADTTVDHGGVSIIGPTNLPATIPFHASQMYGKNITTFLVNMIDDGALELDMDDDVVSETLVARDGKVVHPRLLKQ